VGGDEGGEIMQTIYKPKGAALEYAPWALNIYAGCGHGCSYCYAPACLRKSRAEFARDPKPRKGILEALEKYLKKNGAPDGPVLLSFTSDPYQPAEANFHATRAAIELLASHNCQIRLLTKSPGVALALDGILLRDCKVDFGTTLTGISDEAAKKLEPRAERPIVRAALIETAKIEGLSTWLSMEPVIDIGGAIETLREVVGRVDRIMIGRWNHSVVANKMNWIYFLSEAMKILLPTEQKFYIKNALWDTVKKEFDSPLPAECGWTKERV
jgi:DNA repair photolyase